MLAVRLLVKSYVKVSYVFSNFLCNPALFYKLTDSPVRCAREKHSRCLHLQREGRGN